MAPPAKKRNPKRAPGQVTAVPRARREVPVSRRMQQQRYLSERSRLDFVKSLVRGGLEQVLVMLKNVENWWLMLAVASLSNLSELVERKNRREARG